MTQDEKTKGRSAKGRVLQARIPERLDDELKGQAEQLGTSVSTVVRNILLNTFNLVEGVVSDSAQIARVIQDKKASAGAQKAPIPSGVPASSKPGETQEACIGWQPVVLNRNGVCESCNEILTKGTQAAIGIPVQLRPLLMCMKCLDALGGEDDPADSPSVNG